MKTVTIPDNCEIKIVEKEEKIVTYQDLIDKHKPLEGYYVTACSSVIKRKSLFNNADKNVATSEKLCKAMLAAAMISQLMPYYGGEITTAEWNDNDVPKFVFTRVNDDIKVEERYDYYCFLAFHNWQDRDKFLKYNKQLVKDYFML